MRRDESASTQTTPPIPIKTMFLASVTPTGPHSPQHLLTTAIHTHPRQKVPTSHTSATCSAPVPLKILHQTTSSSHHMLSRGLRGGGLRREAKRKATCTLCILGRPVSVTQDTEGTQRQEDRCSMCLSESLGWWSWEIKGV